MQVESLDTLTDTFSNNSKVIKIMKTKMNRVELSFYGGHLLPVFSFIIRSNTHTHTYNLYVCNIDIREM